jgi:hypothetical protein
MIRSEAEYQAMAARLQEERIRLGAYRAKLISTGLSNEAIKRMTDPMESFIASYRKNWKNGPRRTQGARLYGVFTRAATSPSSRVKCFTFQV